MLHSLPQEIFLKICSYLNFYSRITFSHTCRGVRNRLVNTILYEDLIIPKSHASQIIEQFKTKGIDNAQVKSIHANFLPEQEEYFYQLSDLFPNVKILYTGTCDKSSKIMKMKEIEGSQELKEKLEVYDTRYCHKAILVLINKYTFSHISSLYLGHTFFRARNRFKLDVYQCLSHLPALVKLTLEKFQVNLEFFERMHTVNTSLQHLEMINIKLIIDETEIPQPLNMYQGLKSLKISCEKFIDLQKLFVSYIIEKYPNLKTFDIDNWMLQARSNTPPYHSVTTYREYYEILADQILPLVPRLDVLKIEPRLFKNFFDDIGPSISHLIEFGIYSSKDLFTMFKNIKELQFIQSFDQLTSLSVEAISSRFIYNKKVTIPNIKSLYVFGKVALSSRLIELDKILFTYNGLRTLSLKCEQAKFTIQDPNDTTQHQGLEKLEVQGAEIFSTVNEYIRTCLPNVNDIYWKNAKRPSVCKFNLPKHFIKSLNIDTFCDSSNYFSDRKENFKVHYIVTTNYSTKITNLLFTDPDFKRVTEDNIKEGNREELQIEIICDVLGELKNNDIIIF